MNFNEYFNFAFKNLFRRKKATITNMIIISFSILLILTAFTVSTSITDFISNNINKNLAYRTVFIKYDPMKKNIDEVIKEVSEMPHITKIMKQEQYETYVVVDDFKTDKTNGEIRLLSGEKNILPQVVYGRTINESDKNVAICPLKFIADGSVADRTDLYRTDYINGNDYLNKEISVIYNSYDFSTETPKKVAEHTTKLKIIGLYDVFSNYADDNVCYVPFDVVSSINKTISGNLEEVSEEVYFHPIAIIDDSKNIDHVFENVKNNGYEAVRMLMIDTNLSRNIKLSITALAIITMIVSFVSINLYVVKSIKDRRKEIGILKAIGYKNNNISKIMSVELLIITMLSFAIGFILYLILYFIGYYLTNYGSLNWSRFNVEFPYATLLITIVILLLIPMINSLISLKRIEKINAIDIINK